MDSSVIIPTYHRPQSLIRTLRSLQDQTLPNFETIVVDNAADPQTERMVVEFNQKARLQARYISHPSGGNTGARHRGALEAQGDLLVYTDDDVTFAPRWLEAHLEAYDKEPEVAAAAGPVEPMWETPPPQWLIDYLQTPDESPEPWRPTLFGLMNGPITCTQLIDGRAETVGGFYSLNMSIRRKVLLEVGGFNPEAYAGSWLGDGESGLNYKLWQRGHRIGYVPEARVYHHIPPERMTVDYLCRRMANQGASDAYTDFHRGIPGRLYLARHAISIVLENLKCWSSAWWLRGQTDQLSLDIQLRAALTWSRLRYVVRLMFSKWAREFVLKQDWLSQASSTDEGSRS